MKKLLSYILPIRVKTFYSKINGSLEINLVNGRKVLDTASANYSYGSLQRILHKGLSEIGFDGTIKRVLVLGMGGGSVVQTIREDFKSMAYIELVEIDPEIINIAIHEFEITKYGNLKIIQSDALAYLHNSKDTFDCILVDLFIDDAIPTVFTEPHLISELVKHLTPYGKIIFNTIRSTLPFGVFTKILSSFLTHHVKLKVLDGIEYTNSLILVAVDQSKD